MANQIIIDIGAVANDGTGDPLRTAFNYVNNNFSNVWNTGLPESNIAFSGNRILTVNTNGNLILAPNGIGKVVANVDIVPNANVTHSLGALNRRWNTVYTQFIDVSGDIEFAGDLTVNGNLTVEGDTIQIGNIVTDTKTIQLSNTAVTANAANGSGITVGANDNIATFLYNSTSNVWTTNIGVNVTGNINATGRMSAANISIGNVFTANGVYGEFGAFTGGSGRGLNSIQAGVNTFTFLGSDVIAQFTGNSNAYTQFNFQNINNGTQSSGDFVITADNGNDSTHFLNIGLTGSNWDGTQPNSLGNRLGPNDGYLYIQDGDMIIGTSNGTIETWKFDQTGNLTVPGDILPVGNNTQSLGSATNQWKDLWVSNNTIYINSVPIGLTVGNVLTVNGQDVVTTSNDGQSTIGNLFINGTSISIAGDAILTETQIEISPDVESLAYLQIPNNATADSSNLRLHNDAGNIELGTGSGLNLWYFDNTGNLILPENGNIVSADGWNARFQTTDEGEVRAGITLSPGLGLTRLESFDNQNSNGYGTSDWATGEYINNGGSGEIVFTDAPSIISFFSTIDTSRVFYQVNGGDLLPSAGWGSGGNNITFYTAIPPATSPETVTNFTIYYSNRSVIEMDYDEGEMNILSRGLDVNITSDQSIDIITRDIIRLQNSGNSSGVAIITDSGNAFHTWNFQPNGNLSLPRGGIISEGPSPSYLGDAVTITPANGSDPNQQLKIYPTVVEGNHLHLTSGNLQVTDIFLGDDNQYIRTNNTGGMTIGTGGGETNFGPVWTFDAGGNLLLPGAHTSTITSIANASVYFTAQNNGIDPIATINNVDMGTGLPSSQIEVKADSVWITTNGNAVPKDWIFDNSGDLSAPGNITATGDVSGQILVASQSAPNEGGEIQLSLPSSGTTLTGNIIIDSYQNQIRLFESGNTRGMFVDVPNVSVSGQYAIGYRDVPQIALTGNVTANSITAGKHFYSTTAGNLQVTIPDNANVAFPTGATITIVVNAAGNVIVAQGTGVSLYMAGSSSTGNRTVGAYGLASVMKVATDTWVISGTGVY